MYTPDSISICYDYGVMWEKVSLLLCENSPSMNLAWMDRFCCSSLILFCMLMPLVCRIWSTWGPPEALCSLILVMLEVRFVFPFGKRLFNWLELTTMTFGPLPPLLPLEILHPLVIVRIPLIVVEDEIPFPAIGNTRDWVRPNFTCTGILANKKELYNYNCSPGKVIKVKITVH